MVRVPNEIMRKRKDLQSPFDSDYYRHAAMSMKSLMQITEELYCPDYVANAINTLERIYKSFLEYAAKNCEWYSLPNPHFLVTDHDILGILDEIKQNFPEAYPRTSREEWRAMKRFLRELRCEYTNARYTAYPAYHEFAALRGYIKTEFDLITECLQREDLFEDKAENDLKLDY